MRRRPYRTDAKDTSPSEFEHDRRGIKSASKIVVVGWDKRLETRTEIRQPTARGKLGGTARRRTQINLIAKSKFSRKLIA